MTWKPWKSAEKEVAEFFGGMRRVRMSYSEVAGDIIHPHYSIEVKYGKCIPAKALQGHKCKFLDKAWAQAVSYDAKKEPLVCLKRPRMVGFVIIKDYPEHTLVTTTSIKTLDGTMMIMNPDA